MEQTACLGKIMVFGVVAGLIGFGIGYVAPVLVSQSNLGPLLGILVTGPVGALAGAGLGLARCSREAGVRESKSVVVYWSAICLLALFYTAFLLKIAPRLALGALVLLVILTICTAVAGRSEEAHPAGFLSRHRIPILIAMTLVVVSSLFPPVAAGSAETAGQMRMAFLLDPQLDASREVAPLHVRTALLLLEWVVIIVGASVAIAAKGRQRREAA
jgi:hypothetical protein